MTRNTIQIYVKFVHELSRSDLYFRIGVEIKKQRSATSHGLPVARATVFPWRLPRPWLLPRPARGSRWNFSFCPFIYSFAILQPRFVSCPFQAQDCTKIGPKTYKITSKQGVTIQTKYITIISCLIGLFKQKLINQEQKIVKY